MTRTASIFGLAIVLCSMCFYACDSTESGSSVAGDVAGAAASAAVGKCNYVNIFSGLAECKQYSGSIWSEAGAEDDCLAGGGSAPPDGTWLAESDCAIAPTLGSCAVAPSDGLDYVKAIGGSDRRDCTASAHACTAFEGGTFIASSNCPGYGQAPMSGEASVATIFQWPSLSCVPALAGEPVGATDGEVCTWNLISGSTEEGRSYADYGSCEIVYTNRPYYPLEPWEEPAIEDPRYDDPAWLAESDWVASQVRSSGCSCCHSDAAPLGPARWSIDLGPGWVDTMSEEGLALFAGHTDSSTLGAFRPEDNNGFDRLNSAMPTTDVPRMLAFFLGELDHRGVTNDYIQSFPDIGGPLIVQRDFVPEACGAGEGVDTAGNLVWNGGEARYLYVLSSGSANPGLPPNLDLPAGTVWRADVLYDVAAFPSGVAYGVLPPGALQFYPESGAPEALVSGQQYYLYVLRDVVIPLARCLFQVPYAATAESPNFNSGWDADGDGILDNTDNCPLKANPSQLDADADGFGNACDADLNNDGAVGMDDVARMLTSLNTNADPAADLNGDGFAGLDDLAAALGMLGTPPGPGKDPCGGLIACEGGSQ